MARIRFCIKPTAQTGNAQLRYTGIYALSGDFRDQRLSRWRRLSTHVARAEAALL
jgi:hypothetical protein